MIGIHSRKSILIVVFSIGCIAFLGICILFQGHSSSNIKEMDLTNMFIDDDLYFENTRIDLISNWFSTNYIDVSNFIEIVELKTISCSGINMITFFDASRKPISGIEGNKDNNWETTYHIEVPQDAVFAKVTWGEIICAGELAQADEVIFKYSSLTNVEEKKESSNLIYQFENILCIGDSLTEGDYGSYPGGVKNVHEENYPYYLSCYLNTHVTNAGVCGTDPVWWWEHKNDGKIDPESDYDCIFVFLGTNGGLTDTIDYDTESEYYETYNDTPTGRYCSLIEWLKIQYPDARIFLISFPHNYLPYDWYVKNNKVLVQIGDRYNIPVVDMTVNVPFTKYNAFLYRPIGYDPNGKEDAQKYGNTHFSQLGYKTFAYYLIVNTGYALAR